MILTIQLWNLLNCCIMTYFKSFATNCETYDRIWSMILKFLVERFFSITNFIQSSWQRITLYQFNKFKEGKQLKIKSLWASCQRLKSLSVGALNTPISYCCNCIFFYNNTPISYCCNCIFFFIIFKHLFWVIQLVFFNMYTKNVNNKNPNKKKKELLMRMKTMNRIGYYN